MPRNQQSSADYWAKSFAQETLEGKYRLLKFVGSGKIGFVYRSERVDVPGIEVAVKLMFGNPKAGWETEIKKVAALNLVENVVHFHDLGTAQVKSGGETAVCQYTVWDYIAPGENLKNFLSRVETVPASFIVAVVRRILHVLDACQKKVSRDTVIITPATSWLGTLAPRRGTII